MEEKLLTQKDLAERWQVSVRAVENWRKEGILQPVNDIPVIRFSLSYIAQLEGTKIEKFSPLQRKHMEREMEILKKENEKLKNILSNTLANLAPVINLG